MNADDLTDKPPDGPTISATQVIHDWLLFTAHENDLLYVEAFDIATRNADIAVASEDLELWFTERLAVDPGIVGPFGGVAVNLLMHVLETVRWSSLVKAIQEHGR
jgi:hypothetical protein